ncbi:hypothetical protein EYV94_12785 [Puteibacter caeruleilacunae]|nr:hypothetical protein EYV94_12785 [Puteibacter caeruleilacunae]
MKMNLILSRNKWFLLTRHLFFWSLVIVFFSFLYGSYTNSQNWLYSLGFTTLNGVFFIIFSYVVVYFLIPQLFFKKKYFLFFLLVITVGILISLLKLSFSGFLYYSTVANEAIGYSSSMGWPAIFVNVKDMSFLAAIFALIKYSKDWYIIEIENKELTRQNVEAEISMLKSQTEPDFLFNTLNNVYAMAVSEDPETQNYIRKLRELMGFLANLEPRSEIQLDLAIEMVRSYIDIERIRYFDHLDLEVKFEGDFHGKSIAPYLLFPIIENCFKHGSSNDSGSPWIKIAITIEGNHLKVRTKNSIADFSGTVNKHTRILEGVRRRLEIIYPDHFALDIKRTLSEFHLVLDLELISKQEK